MNNRLTVRQHFPKAICVKSGDNCGFYIWESTMKEKMLGQGKTASTAWKSVKIPWTGMTPFNNSPKLIGNPWTNTTHSRTSTFLLTKTCETQCLVGENPLQAIGSFIVKIVKTIGKKNLATANLLAMRVVRNVESLVTHLTAKNIQNGLLTSRGIWFNLRHVTQHSQP